MKRFLYTIIEKWPVKILGVSLLLVGIIAFFVSNITLSTGNETLIDPATETYQDNLAYQKTFGTDPVMIVFTGDNQDDLLTHESLSVLNTLSNEIEDLDGVFYVNSPIGIIEYAAGESGKQYQQALTELSNGLLTMSTNLSSMSLIGEDMNPDELIQTFETLKTTQEDLSSAASNQIDIMTTMKDVVTNEITRLENYKTTLDPVTESAEIESVTQTIMILTNVFDVYDQLITIDTNIEQGTTQTALALDGIQAQLNMLFTQMSAIESNIADLATTLETMGLTLESLAVNFNMFAGGFPTSSDTLKTMLYPNDTLNPMIENYFVDETHLYMSIILEEGTTNDQIEVLLNTIDESLKETTHEDALVSGKPVLDYDIQTSMTSSMRTMMIMAVVIMILVLLILFPVPIRLLPLFVVLLAVITTIGIMGLVSIPLTMVSMAVFPVLIGLGIDYSIQFHNRYTEEITRGESHE